MSIISSPSNPAIKRIRALRQRKTRDESGLYFVEGIRLVGEALQLGAPLELLVIAPERIESDFARQVVAEAKQRGVQVMEVTPEVFESFSAKDNPQGMGAVIRQRWTPLEMISACRRIVLDRALCSARPRQYRHNPAYR